MDHISFRQDMDLRRHEGRIERVTEDESKDIFVNELMCFMAGLQTKQTPLSRSYLLSPVFLVLHS